MHENIDIGHIACYALLHWDPTPTLPSKFLSAAHFTTLLLGVRTLDLPPTSTFPTLGQACHHDFQSPSYLHLPRSRPSLSSHRPHPLTWCPPIYTPIFPSRLSLQNLSYSVHVCAINHILLFSSKSVLKITPLKFNAQLQIFVCHASGICITI